MPGPLPKPATIRQRRNRSTSRAMLPAEMEPLQRPNLPACPNEPGKWHRMARRWWAEVWASPMHYEFLGGDLPALFRLLALVDRFWKTGSLAVAKEIRLMEREFGLTPLSRRRLEWSVVQAEESKEKFEERHVRRARVIDADPRELLGDE